MNKILKISNWIFNVLLVVIILFALEIFVFEFLEKTILSTYFFGYAFLFFIIPLLVLSIFIFLFSNFKKYGFIKGIKESSIKIFILIIWSLLIWGLAEYGMYKNNKINVKIVNVSKIGISNITLVGRNAKSKIDTLAPDKSETIIFRGKNINYRTENDYENEIRLLYFYQKKMERK